MRKEIPTGVLSTAAIIGLLIAALAFALLGFLKAPDSMIAPATVAGYMLLSAGLFVALAVLALTRQRIWQRFLGVAAATGAIYMLVMAVLFFRGLSAITTSF